MVACALLVLAAPALAQDGDQAERPRHWSVGWENGITLRRAVHRWDFSVAAGPADWLRDADTYSWGPALPDSQQGIRTVTDNHRQESGFVRLGAARELSRWREFSLHGTIDGTFDWSHSQDTYEDLSQGSGDYDRRVTDYDSETWTLAVGLRMAWRPVPFLGIQVRLGLRLSSETSTGTTTRFESYARQTYTLVEPGREIRFEDFGNYGTGSLEFFVWF